jgi:hypothetical protein
MFDFLALSGSSSGPNGKRICCLAGFKFTHRRCNTSRSMRHAGNREPHLDARKRAHQDKLIALTEMTDAECFACKLSESCSK